MLLPLWLLAAYVAKLGYELMVDPILPVEAGNSAGLFLILTAAFLAEYELLVLLRLFRKDGDPPVLTRMLHGLPLLCYLLLLAFGDWLAFVRYQIGVQGLALTEFLDLAPFFFFQCLGLLGSLRVYGRTGLAWQRLQGSMLIAPMLFLLLGLQDLLLLHPLSRAAILELPGVFECSVGLSSILVAVVFPLLFILVVARKKLPQKDVGDALFVDLGRE